MSVFWIFTSRCHEFWVVDNLIWLPTVSKSSTEVHKIPFVSLQSRINLYPAPYPKQHGPWNGLAPWSLQLFWKTVDSLGKRNMEMLIYQAPLTLTSDNEWAGIQWKISWMNRNCIARLINHWKVVTPHWRVNGEQDKEAETNPIKSPLYISNLWDPSSRHTDISRSGWHNQCSVGVLKTSGLDGSRLPILLHCVRVFPIQGIQKYSMLSTSYQVFIISYARIWGHRNLIAWLCFYNKNPRSLGILEFWKETKWIQTTNKRKHGI